MEVIVVAVAVGISIAVLSGGTVTRILDLRLRWPWLLFFALGARVVLGVWSPGDGWPDPVGYGVFVATFAALVVFCLANLHLTGIAVVLIGTGLNLTVILANGGMPVRLADDAPAERVEALENSVTHLPDDDADTLSFLGEIIVLPDPVDRSISFGDLILGVGLVDVLVHASRVRKRFVPTPVDPASGDGPDPVSAGHQPIEGGDHSGVMDVGSG